MSAPVEPCTIYVRNVDYKATAKDLADGFSRFGQVSGSRIGLTVYRGQKVAAGYGFVDFTTPESCQNALQCKDEIKIGNRVVIVRPARPRRERDTLFVRGIPESVTVDVLKEVFAKYNPKDIRLVKHNAGSVLGFAFVQCASGELLTQALADCKNVQIGGQTSTCSLAHPRRGGRRGFGGFGRRRYRRQGRRAPRAPKAPAENAGQKQ